MKNLISADRAYRIAAKVFSSLDKPSAIAGLFWAGVAICWVILPILSKCAQAGR